MGDCVVWVCFFLGDEVVICGGNGCDGSWLLGVGEYDKGGFEVGFVVFIVIDKCEMCVFWGFEYLFWLYIDVVGGECVLV